MEKNGKYWTEKTAVPNPEYMYPPNTIAVYCVTIPVIYELDISRLQKIKQFISRTQNNTFLKMYSDHTVVYLNTLCFKL